MTEYQTHGALVATLETEIVRLRAVNAELRSSIQAPIQPDTKLVEAARQALEVLSELAEWESEGDPRHPASVAITALREALDHPQQDLDPAARTGWVLREVLFDGGEAVGHREPQPAAVDQEPVALGPLAKRRVFDYIRGSYDLGYNDARNARAVPGDNAPGYKGRDVEVDHGGALFNALRACITAPQPARQPLTDAQIASACFSYRHDFGLLSKQEQESIIFQAREWERALGKEREIGGEA